MSGLEAPALVVACIAALLAMRQVDQGDEAKRERREDRRSNKEYLDRQMVLHKDSLRIQQEYNSNLVRGLRDIHLRGDGTSHKIYTFEMRTTPSGPVY